MPYPAVKVGTGATITITDASSTAVAVGEVVSIQLSGIEVGTIDTTHLGTTDARTFMPSDLYDGGTVSIEAHWNPENGLPIQSGPCSVDLVWPGPGAEPDFTAQFDAFVQSVEVSTPLEEKMTASVTLKVTGAIGIVSP